MSVDQWHYGLLFDGELVSGGRNLPNISELRDSSLLWSDDFAGVQLGKGSVHIISSYLW